MKNWQFVTFAALALILSACPGAGSTADTTKPTVSLGSSSSNVTAAGSIALTANAADNVGVTKVEFFDGATSLGTDSSAGDGFTQSVALALSDNGTKSYTATASDAAGNSQTSAAVSVTVNIATVDTTAPTIVSSTPANAGTGVLATDNIVITFSEPMNKLVTQSAYQSATSRILPAQVQFSFNTEGTVLTINPNASLLIAGGADPAIVVAVPYAFQITNLATDLAGNPLATSSFTFTTQRRITQNLPGLESLSGEVRATDGSTNGCIGVGRACAGDSGAAGNLQYKGFISFDITGIPAGVQSFEFANLNMNQVSTFKDGVAGDPYADLGGAVSLEHVNFDTLNLAAAFTPAALSTVGNISTNATLEVKTLSVLTQLQNDITNRVARGQRSQYRIAFPTVTDIDLKFDAAIFASPTAATNPSTLSVRYFLP
jgi:Bacterial Ig-like domain/Bacterial Ig domain